jgi:two-component system chemotaxis response regulator CheY
MIRKVLDVGQCGPDHWSISNLLLKNFSVDIAQADSFDEAISMARESSFDLILINRILDADGSPGLDILRVLKSEPATADVPVMLVSNFEDSQQEAISMGAVRGFGKSELNKPTTVATLSKFLAG